MTTRVTQGTISRILLDSVARNNQAVQTYSNQISSGEKVSRPGDSVDSPTIENYRQMVARIDSYRSRIDGAEALLNFQEAVVGQTSDVVTRATELASQGINGTYSPERRALIAAEVWQLRDQLVQLANSKYQDRYIYGAADDDDPPYDGLTYTNPASGVASIRYAFDGEDGTSTTRSVQISDGLTIRVTTSGDQVFSNAIQAIERLGRALEGYETLPTSGAPDGTGVAYTFPADYNTQTNAIQNALDLLKQTQTDDLHPERTDIGGRIARLNGARSTLEIAKSDSERVLEQLQGVDVSEAAMMLTQAQTALQASYQIGLRIMNQSILDYI
jgi:flagellar hook-associated protein 3 FlgL